MTKTARQHEILKLIRSTPVHTQDDLAARLQSAGVEASQVTLSRDLRELGVVKTPEGYQEARSLGSDSAAEGNLRRLVREFVLESQVAQNLVVLRTQAGAAGSVALALDSARQPEVVGTIAGDDTIFIATRDPSSAESVRRMIANL